MNEMLETFTVTFFGHRYIDNPFRVVELLESVIYDLIKQKPFVEFLVGRNGDFDQFVSSVVLRAKKKYRDDNSFLILILPYPTAEYQNNIDSFENYYDEIEICDTSSKAHFKSAIQTRNRQMVDRADLIICYLEHNSGGAYQTVQYAKKQGKAVINLADEL